MPGETHGKRLALRFAKECRRLASECVEGTAPRLIVGHFVRDGEHCAMGLALHRADPERGAWGVFWGIANGLGLSSYPTCETAPQSANLAVIDANNKTPAARRHLAVVFPLLWLADEVERVAREHA